MDNDYGNVALLVGAVLLRKFSHFTLLFFFFNPSFSPRIFFCISCLCQLFIPCVPRWLDGSIAQCLTFHGKFESPRVT
jgi:hypothetical protein